MPPELLPQLLQGNIRALARALSLVENGVAGWEHLLSSLPPPPEVRVVGITGPPGAGKSTLVDALIGELVADGHKVAVLCVDPSSPFHQGAVLGDRIRMSRWYTHPSVFIRSLASRGALGGLHPQILELVEVVKAAGYRYILLETVGVGQSEIEVASLADTTVVVLVPEAGDEVQTMKAGLMEIADLFVVNKADRPEADAFLRHLRSMLAPVFSRTDAEVKILRTVAPTGEGIPELKSALDAHPGASRPAQRTALLAERAWRLIAARRMGPLTREQLAEAIRAESAEGPFHLYRFVDRHA